MSEPVEPSLDESNRRLALIDAAFDGVDRYPSSEQWSELELRAGRDASDASDGEVGG